jgi:hypothetical protein
LQYEDVSARRRRRRRRVVGIERPQREKGVLGRRRWLLVSPFILLAVLYVVRLLGCVREKGLCTERSV